MRELDRLMALIGSHYGLLARDDRAHSLEQAIETLSKSRGVNPARLVDMAASDPRVLRELAGGITVPESFFFRHEDHFDILTDRIRERLPTLSNTERIVIWSAGCSEGQEPYSIAMTLKERFSAEDCEKVSIIASDIDMKAIASARQGHYFRWSFRGVSDLRKSRFFKRIGGEKYQLSADIRNMVTVFCQSIQEHLRQIPAASLDCIFFRNVGMYLNPAAQAEIFRRFHAALRGDGLLFLSPSDAMPLRKCFKWLSSDSTSVYKITDEPASPQGNEKQHVSAPKVTTVKKPVRTTRPMAASPRKNKNDHRALSLADRGNYIDAMAAANGLVERHPHGKSGYLVRGQIHLASDELDDAIADLRRASFIDPDDAMVRYWYALSLQKSGAARRSLIQINNLVSRLTKMHLEAVLEDGNTTARELLGAARHLKEFVK